MGADRSAGAVAVTVARRRGDALIAWAAKRGGALAIFVLLIVAWEAAVRLTGIKEYLLPTPSNIWTEFWKRREIVAVGA